MEQINKLYTEVIIAGAGIIGATLAALLAVNGINCALIETRPKKKARRRIDSSRAFAINLASRNILEKTGAWAAISRDRIGHFQKIQVWDEQGTGKVCFDSGELYEPIMGYIIAQTVLANSLEATLAKTDKVRWYRPHEPVNLKTRPEQMVVELDDGRQLAAKLLVAADGFTSRVRKLAGIHYPTKDYRQSAVTCVAETDLPHRHTAKQRFMYQGPLAFLPMAGARQNAVVWSTTPQHAAKLATMDKKSFHKLLAEAFEQRSGKIIKTGPRAVFPLASAQAAHYCRPRLALVGDAAHSIHPLAGQGANLGLLDVASLVEIILFAKAKRRDLGSFSLLRRYERWRKSETCTMMMFLEGFKYLFESQFPAIPWLRNVGMNLFDVGKPIKLQIMKRAMGLTGDLPEIACEVTD